MIQQPNFQQKRTIYYQTETTNKSFIDMYYILKDKGINNNKFFLALYDRDLLYVNPYDPNLSFQTKAKVIRECMINYWYFIREVARIPESGGSTTNGARYRLHRGNLAMGFLFMLNWNQFVELPRQHGKTTAALLYYLWAFNFSGTNSQIMFIHKNHDGSKSNLQNLKRYREILPSYLRMDSIIAPDGKKMRISNTVETLQHPTNGNLIKTLPSAKNKAAANNLGRGCTMPLHYYDEFAFMLFNETIYLAATPAYSTASKNAKKHGSPYGILITTTPGDLLTDEGSFAYSVRNNATPWLERYYDYDAQHLLELRDANKQSSFFHVIFTYAQLGSGENYFNEMVKDMQKNYSAIRREVLLEWAKATTDCPFSNEDLETIDSFCIDPIRQIPLGSYGQYTLDIFNEFDKRYPPIIGVDVAGAMYKDSSAITIIDSKTTRVCATLNCNYISSNDLADCVYEIVTKYMKNAIVNVERNGGFGASVLQKLSKSSIKKNLYFEIKERVLEERINGAHIEKRKVKVKEFGTNNTEKVRNNLLDVLDERVRLHKDKFVAKILHDELQGMEVKKNGKIEHSTNTHDDQVFSYLMALYVWYFGQNLAANFNISKRSLITDQDLEEAVDNIDGENNTDTINLEKIDIELDNNELIESQIKYLEPALKQKSFRDLEYEQYVENELSMSRLLNNNPQIKKKYADKYSLDINDSSYGTIMDEPIDNKVDLPDYIYDLDYDESNIEYSKYSGNLGKTFEQLMKNNM